MNAYKDFHAFTCVSVTKTCVADLVLKNKNVISHSCLKKLLGYFHKCVFSIKSRLSLLKHQRWANEKLNISLYVRVHAKTMLKKFCVLNLRTFSKIKSKNSTGK